MKTKKSKLKTKNSCDACDGIEEYERREADMEILSLLVRGEQEIAAGAGHDLDEVMADVDEIQKADTMQSMRNEQQNAKNQALEEQRRAQTGPRPQRKKPSPSDPWYQTLNGSPVTSE